MTVQEVKDTKRKRRVLLVGVVALFLCAGTAYGIYWFVHGRFHETTDDAYVGGNLVQITPQVAGMVTAIHADDTNYVNAGQTLVSLDKADAREAIRYAINYDDINTLLAGNGKIVQEVIPDGFLGYTGETPFKYFDGYQMIRFLVKNL